MGVHPSNTVEERTSHPERNRCSVEVLLGQLFEFGDDVEFSGLVDLCDADEWR